MVRSAAHAIWIAVDAGVTQQVADAVEEHKRRRAVLSSHPQWRTHRLPRAEAAQVRAAWRTHIQQLRTAGDLLDTRDALIEYGVRHEMTTRSWNHEWDPAPEQAWEQGRWPGSRDTGPTGYPERLAARLDATLVAQVVAACWHTSLPAITALRAWRDAYPGITPARYRLDADGRKKLTGPLAEYEHLAAKVTTTGTIWRAGVTHALTHTLTHATTPADT